MNKLLTFEGGQPLVTGDLDFLQQCYSGVLEALGKALSQDVDCVLHGLEDDGTGQYSAGAVYIGGEVLLVPSPVNIGKAAYLCFRQTEKEERVFADSRSHKVYRVVEPYPANTTEGAYKYMESGKFTRLADVLSGEAYRKNLTGVTYGEDVLKGYVYYYGETVGGATKIRFHAAKLHDTDDNLIFSYDVGTCDLIGIDADYETNKVFTLRCVNGECRIYNADGTAHRGKFLIKDAILIDKYA